MKNLLVALLLVLGLMVVPQVASAQCPMCKAAVTSGSNYGAKESNLVSGLNTGILYLFVLPYASIMLIGFVVVVNYRKRKREEARELSDTRVEDVIGDHKPGRRDE
jgi:hypothetical protein